MELNRKRNAHFPEKKQQQNRKAQLLLLFSDYSLPIFKLYTILIIFFYVLIWSFIHITPMVKDPVILF